MKKSTQMKIIKKKGRWGIVHYEIEGINSGDYQREGNITFNSEEEALAYMDELKTNQKES